MGGQTEGKKTTKHICAGLLAHVDAGKTTLSERILYQTGSIRSLGRVDHRDTFLDTNELERARGITIFSKQASFSLGGREITLLDTPGHVDFSAEMERTLQVLDYAILVINGADGVQSHTLTLWKLLKYYRIPVFLFVNKMDQPGTDREQLMQELQKRLDDRCICFDCPSEQDTWLDQLAMCEESLMEEFLETGTIGSETIGQAVAGRHVFPCYFGSALKGTGVEDLLSGLSRYAPDKVYPEDFGAKVYKITHDAQGTRLTHLKITGGSLRVKTILSEEKVDQIRIYSGTQYQTVETAEAGTVCAVTGLTRSRSGDRLGAETSSEMPLLTPVLNYQICLPDGCDPHTMIPKLRLLEEEEPQLHIVWNEVLGEIHAQVMGEIEIEILKSLIRERFGIEVEFGSGSIVYKETISGTVEGVGHFEPLRHYAEVHLLMEPGEPGSGLQFDSRCSEDMLGRSWQRLVLTHLEERQHRGVLTGAEITDMKITLIAGRAHQKHTEGGDFRQATFRAVRQGLKKSGCILLEPMYEYQLELPTENVGRALSDIQRMSGTSQVSQGNGQNTLITGTAPVSTMRTYQSEVASYSKGLGRLSCTPKGYAPCHNAEEVIAAAEYDSEADPDNPTGSVFCAHGAGFIVNWMDVERYMHVESGAQLPSGPDTPADAQTTGPDQGYPSAYSGSRSTPARTSDGYAEEKELAEIFARTYGSGKKEKQPFKKTIAPRDVSAQSTYRGHSSPSGRDQYLLVDGYNIIFAWDDLRELAAVSLDSARTKLMDLLCNYQGYKKMTLILVFDAYKVAGGLGSVTEYHNIHVVYTKEAETADQYIEKTAHEIGHKYDVTVATSDNLEQMIIWGSGAKRLSAPGLKEEMEAASAEIRQEYLERRIPGSRNLPLQKIGELVNPDTPDASNDKNGSL